MRDPQEKDLSHGFLMAFARYTPETEKKKKTRKETADRTSPLPSTRSSRMESSRVESSPPATSVDWNTSEALQARRGCPAALGPDLEAQRAAALRGWSNRGTPPPPKKKKKRTKKRKNTWGGGARVPQQPPTTAFPLVTTMSKLAVFLVGAGHPPPKGS